MSSYYSYLQVKDLAENKELCEGARTDVQKQRKNQSMILSWQHAGSRPIDDKTNVPAGTAQLKELAIVRHVDRATPYLLQAFGRGTPLAVTLRLAIADQGKEHKDYFVVTLKDAYISSMRTYAGQTPEGKPAQMEDVSFTYNTILWNHFEPGTSKLDGSYALQWDGVEPK